MFVPVIKKKENYFIECVCESVLHQLMSVKINWKIPHKKLCRSTSRTYTGCRVTPTTSLQNTH